VPSFAQSDPLLGTWQLNLAKSKFSPGPGPKTQTVKVEPQGQDQKVTVTGVNAQGNPINNVFTNIYDGMPHPASNPNFDASARVRVDANTLVNSRTKGGKLVGTQIVTVSSDGKMLTDTVVLIDTNGRPINNVTVYDKQ
jgi:hypothetical protein